MIITTHKTCISHTQLYVTCKRNRARAHVTACCTHVQFTKPRNRTSVTEGSDNALAMRAILWAAQFPRASIAAQAALTGTLATLWVCRVCRSLVCVTAPTDGRTVLPTIFPQEQVSSDVRRRTRWATSLVSCRARTPARLRIRSVSMPQKSSAGWRPRSAPVARTPIMHQSLQLSPSAIIHRRRCQLAERCPQSRSGLLGAR